MKIPFSPPDMTELEALGASEAIRSGWITTGPKTKEFERQIAEYCHVNKAVCLNSQTACAEMALRLLGIGAENGGSSFDEVIVPAYTYTASASVVCHVGAKLVLIDSQTDSLEMDYEALEKAINEHTKAIIPVDLGGIPCDYDRMFAIVENKKNLFKATSAVQEALGRVAICADAAHAFGASWHGKMVGSIADFSSFSFHAVKNLTTAEGGALTWNIPGIDDEELYHQAQLYSLHGQSKDALAKTQLGAWEYDIVGPWYKCNMTDIMAALCATGGDQAAHPGKRAFSPTRDWKKPLNGRPICSRNKNCTISCSVSSGTAGWISRPSRSPFLLRSGKHFCPGW